MKHIKSVAPCVFFGLYSPIALIASNLGQVEFIDTRRSLFLTFLASVILYILMRMILRDSVRASLVSLGLIIPFFFYGHFYEIVKNWTLGGIIIGRHRYLLPLFVVISLGWIVWVLWKLKDRDRLLSALTLVGSLTLVLPIFTISSYLMPGRVELQEEGFSNPHPSENMSIEQQGLLPNIYYIVLDGYARSDVLSELYNHDNSRFINFLESRGFFVAKSSYSNYSHTTLSLASSLNLEYINYLADYMNVNSKDLRPLTTMIENSFARGLFESQGYSLVAFETGYPPTTIDTAEFLWGPDSEVQLQEFALLAGWSLNGFEGLLLETTAVRVVMDLRLQEQNRLRDLLTEFPYQLHRTRILYTISQLSEVARLKGNYFVFAHILAPHPPFVFGSNGEEVQNSGAFTLQDYGCCPRAEYIERYTEQLTYISKVLQRELDKILTLSDIPPIIIVQGDHGPGAHQASEVDETNLEERMAILNAYYFPFDDESMLDESITPVNTFRIVLNQFSDEKLELLADKIYFSPGGRPYDFHDVTDQLFIP